MQLLKLRILALRRVIVCIRSGLGTPSESGFGQISERRYQNHEQGEGRHVCLSNFEPPSRPGAIVAERNIKFLPQKGLNLHW